MIDRVDGTTDRLATTSSVDRRAAHATITVQKKNGPPVRLAPALGARLIAPALPANGANATSDAAHVREAPAATTAR